MRAKPDMKPWVHTDKSKMSSVGAALTELVLALRCGCAAPLGLNKCTDNNKYKACALGYEGVSPLQGSSTSSLSLYYFDAITLLHI